MTFGAAAISQYAHLYGWDDYELYDDDDAYRSRPRYDELPGGKNFKSTAPEGREWSPKR